MGVTQEAHFISYCRLLPPREIAKSFSTNRMVGRGGGDRKDVLLNKVHALNVLQPPTPANRNKRNKEISTRPANTTLGRNRSTLVPVRPPGPEP